MKHIWSLLLIGCMFWSQTNLLAQDYYYEAYKPFNNAIPSPEEFLGYPIGEYHTRHDLVVAYMYTLAELSDRAEVSVYGKTHENRKLLLLQIGSPSNLANLDRIREEHLKVVDPKTTVNDFQGLPLFINLAYGVHGNEPSGTEAAMLVAYTLVASNSESIKKYLQEVVVFLDPVINPDGRDRHSNWVNSFKGHPLIADKYDIEHNEGWPRGRTNHYLFDLNRDLLLGVNPESKGRLQWYHDWYPNVVTDFHEMRTNSTYFFEPKNRSASINPITPAENRDVLNKAFAKQFATDLDQIGALYFTDEVFDSTYPGYGSTYMDLHGALALLFEQASSRGHLQETKTGQISFPSTIRNQYVSSMATLKGAVTNKTMLYNYQSKFFQKAIKKGKRAKVKGYVFGDPYDRNRNKAFLDLLLQHQIEVYKASKDMKVNNTSFKAQSSYVVPSDQKQYYMVQTLFETYNSYRDSVFYDTSSWSMVNFYNMKYQPLAHITGLGDRVTQKNNYVEFKALHKSSYAYLIPYDDYYAPAFLYDLQRNGLKVKVSSKPFSISIEGKEKKFQRGTLLVSIADQMGIDQDSIYKMVSQGAEKYRVQAYGVETGMTIIGKGLGSESFEVLSEPRAMMVVGGSVNAYEAGEVWHLFEDRMGMPLVKVDESSFYKTDIYRYNVIILVSGNYRFLNKLEKDRLKQWVADGNTLITSGKGTDWVVKQKIVNEAIFSTKLDSIHIKERRDYELASNSLKKQNIGGAIVGIDLDITHPIAYGYRERELPVYKNNRVWLVPSKNQFSTVGKYLGNPHIDGYISKENLEIMKRSASIIVSKRGKGRAVLFADNPNFRGAWYGTNKLFMNAVFFGSIIEVPK